MPFSFLIAAAVAGVRWFYFFRDGELSRRDGTLLIVWFVAVILVLFRTIGGRLVASTDDDDAETRRRYPLVWLIGGLAAMTVGGELLGLGLQAALTRLGISPTLLGNTAIAAATEAEELARVTVPTRRGHSEVAAANIGGTAIHFLSPNAGILALARPLPFDAETMRLHLPAAVAAPAAFCAILALRGGINRGAGLILAALYVASMALAVAGAFGWALR